MSENKVKATEKLYIQDIQRCILFIHTALEKD